MLDGTCDGFDDAFNDGSADGAIGLELGGVDGFDDG